MAVESPAPPDPTLPISLAARSAKIKAKTLIAALLHS
jgi:hypothetical protein